MDSVAGHDDGTAPSGPQPRPKPACSTSQAAEVFTSPLAASGWRGAPSGSAAACSGVSRGLVKNDPVDQVS
ncbi:MAG: hypothetical protein PGN11_22595 [Quadrisphaera sp.]